MLHPFQRSRAASAIVLATFGCLSPLRAADAVVQKSPVTAQVTELAPLKTLVTSLGAAVADGHLYIYGGHLGSPHEYAAELQARQLLRLKLAKPTEWEIVGEGPPRTGLAMVAYGGRLYRVGGWEAKNAKGAEQDLHSTRDFARFDPKSGQWQELAPLPEARSSHDAALVGSRLFVVGGWDLAGEKGGQWHETAYVATWPRTIRSGSRSPSRRSIAAPSRPPVIRASCTSSAAWTTATT